MARSREFDFDTAVADAWKWCWEYYCEGEHPRQSWLTATDLERRIRADAAEKLQGLKPGSVGADAWGHRVRITPPGRGAYRGGNLLGAVRRWLIDQAIDGKLESHNFGRGHISGQRYRPAGQGLTESELATIEKKRKRAAGEGPVHYQDPATRGYARKTLCTAAARAKVQRASYRRVGSSKSLITAEIAKVTCPRCLKAIQAVVSTIPSKE